MSENRIEKLLPFFVYILFDPNDFKPFYVGMGQNTRDLDHKAGENDPKEKKIKEIKSKGQKELRVIIGRYETREEALSVESTLINWVYGYDNLTNQNRAFGNIFNSSNDSDPDSLIISNNSYFSSTGWYDFRINTSQENYTLFNNNTFIHKYNDEIGSMAHTTLRIEENDHSIFRNNTFRGFNEVFDLYNNNFSTIENNLITQSYWAFNENGTVSPASINNNILYSSNLINGSIENFPIGLGDVMTINTKGDSTDTYGNLFLDPKLIPSDSTIVYGWELDENGLVTFFSDPSQQYYNNIGNVEYGWV